MAWVKQPLGEVCRVIGGGTPPKDRVDLYNGDIPWATVRDMHNETISETEFSITKDAIRISATNIIPAGNVIIASRVGLGKVCYVERDTAINQDLRGIVPFNRDQLSTRFLFWWFKSVSHLIKQEGTGATVQGVKLPFIKSLLIPIPPLLDQRRIVAILDEAFQGIATVVANAEKNLASAREIFGSYLKSVFTKTGKEWTEQKLGEIAQFIDYRGKTPPKRDAGIRLITARNVKMGYIRRAPEEFIEPSAYDAWMTRGFPRKGDVLFTTEAPLGNVAQLDTDEKVIIGQRLITFQTDDRVLDRTFLKFALMSQPVQEEILRRATGATVLGIKASLLKHVPVSFPKALSEQVAIAARIEEILEACHLLESLCQRKLTAFGELKQATLVKAFNGELTAQSADTVQQAAA